MLPKPLISNVAVSWNLKSGSRQFRICSVVPSQIHGYRLLCCFLNHKSSLKLLHEHVAVKHYSSRSKVRQSPITVYVYTRVALSSWTSMQLTCNTQQVPGRQTSSCSEIGSGSFSVGSRLHPWTADGRIYYWQIHPRVAQFLFAGLSILWQPKVEQLSHPSLRPNSTFLFPCRQLFSLGIRHRRPYERRERFGEGL